MIENIEEHKGYVIHFDKVSTLFWAEVDSGREESESLRDLRARLERIAMKKNSAERRSLEPVVVLVYYERYLKKASVLGVTAGRSHTKAIRTEGGQLRVLNRMRYIPAEGDAREQPLRDAIAARDEAENALRACEARIGTLVNDMEVVSIPSAASREDAFDLERTMLARLRAAQPRKEVTALNLR